MPLFYILGSTYIVLLLVSLRLYGAMVKRELKKERMVQAIMISILSPGQINVLKKF